MFLNVCFTDQIFMIGTIPSVAPVVALNAHGVTFNRVNRTVKSQTSNLSH